MDLSFLGVLLPVLRSCPELYREIVIFKVFARCVADVWIFVEAEVYGFWPKAFSVNFSFGFVLALSTITQKSV